SFVSFALPRPPLHLPPSPTRRSSALHNISPAGARGVRPRGKRAGYPRIRPPAAARLGLATAALREARRPPEPPAEWPRHTRGEILIAVRMAGPVAPIPMTPLPDEEDR